MKKQSVKNYKKPGFLAGAALLAVTSMAAGCSRANSSELETTKAAVGATSLAETKATAGETTAAETATVRETELVLEGEAEVPTDENPLVTEGVAPVPTEESTDVEWMGDVIVAQGIENLTENIEKETVSGPENLDKYQGIVEGLSDFSIELFKKSTSKAVKAGENALISPESVYLALGLTANGAAEDTLAAMLKVIAGTDDIDSINTVMRYIIDHSGGYSDTFKFNIVNSVWLDINDSMTFNKDFLVRARSYYDADVYQGELPGAVDYVNAWVNEKTEGMISKIVDEIAEETRAILINAICFEGKWAQQYEDYQVNDGRFTKEDGTEQVATMLNGDESIYICDENTTGFLKYYEGGDYAFMAMLPAEGISMVDYVNSFTPEKFKNLLDTRKSGSNIIVDTKLPEFKYDYGIVLNDILSEMGMSVAFDGEAANFSNMADMTYENLFISKVIHKTHIELDRNGTKAAAVTAVIMDGCMAVEPVELERYTVYLDRPFVYSIVDMTTGMPAFIGVVNSVE